jgi:pimeloyl-ACP methyl ester carboxylesterase
VSEPAALFEIPRHDVPRGGRSGFTVVDGSQTHYLEWGPSAAPAVVCLHGGAQTAYMWEELGAALSADYHVVAPDLPGHGDSDPGPLIDRTELAGAIAPFVAEFGIERAVFVGASLGGIVSLTLAAEHPELVAGIALIDIGHRLEDEGVRRIVDFMTAHESFASLDEAAVAVGEYLPQRRAVRSENLRRNLRERPDGRWEWKHQLGRQLRERMGETEFQPGDWRALMGDLEGDLGGLRSPVLVLRGRESDVLSSEGAEEVAALIPDARLKTIGAAGHHAAGDNPESTVDLVRTFLAEVGW